MSIGSIQRYQDFPVTVGRTIGQDFSGEITNTFNGETYQYSNSGEYSDALAALAESEANYKREKQRLDLLISSGGSAAQIKSIFKNTAKIINGIEFFSPDELYQMAEMVKDAVKAEARSMTLAELKKYASEHPELQSLVHAREFKVHKAGLSLLDAENRTGNDLKLRLVA